MNLAALEELLVRFSYLVVEQPWISEIDINPLLASPERLIALDARVVVYGKDVKADKLPKPAIRPYPVQYVYPWKLKNGTPVTIRPIRPEDEPLMVKFHQTLSEQSVYYRYFSQLKLDQRIAHERLIRMCFNDYDREIALVAEHKDPKTGAHEILGVGRLSKARGMNEAEFALIISDQYQRNGLGRALLKVVRYRFTDINQYGVEGLSVGAGSSRGHMVYADMNPVLVGHSHIEVQGKHSKAVVEGLLQKGYPLELVTLGALRAQQFDGDIDSIAAFLEMYHARASWMETHATEVRFSNLEAQGGAAKPFDWGRLLRN